MSWHHNLGGLGLNQARYFMEAVSFEFVFNPVIIYCDRFNTLSQNKQLELELYLRLWPEIVYHVACFFLKLSAL